MNRRTVLVLLLHEFRMLLRDRRTVILAIALPLAAMPVFVYATRKFSDRQKQELTETVYKYAVTGSEAAAVRSMLSVWRSAQESGAIARDSKEDEEISSFKFEEVRVEDPEAELQAGKIQFYLEGLNGSEADLRDEKKKAEAPPARPDPQEESSVARDPERPPGAPVVLVYYLGNQELSRMGRIRIEDVLREARSEARSRLLRRHGFPVDPRQVFPVDSTTVASLEQVSGSYLGQFLTFVLVMFMLSGGSIAAMDIIAGEKERKSLETLLTTAVRHGEIVLAKQIAVLSVALVIVFIQVANILAYVTFKLIELPEDFVLEAPPEAVVTLLVLLIPLAAFIAGILVMISAYAKSYKEAQLYFFPVYLLCILPSLAAVLPGISLRSAIVLVPLANVSVAVREILVGRFDWPMIAATFAVMCLAAAWTLHVSAGMLSKESLITASEADAADFAGGSALFPKHVFRWYAVMGAVMFAVAVNVPQLATFRAQLLFNEVVIFLGGAALMIWKYRLNVREALALRPVKPAVWFAILLAIPSANIVGIGVFRLANLIFPVPRQMLEQFGQSVFPEGIPLWQLLFFIAILPGICEEIAFRGTLLYGLHRRFRAVGLALTVGIVFGFFHLALFRIIPTAFLGIILTAVALLTGSIFPGMLLHAGNNAFAFGMSRLDLQLDHISSWLYAAAAAVFALSLYILYLARTPYPGVRTPEIRNSRIESRD